MKSNKIFLVIFLLLTSCQRPKNGHHSINFVNNSNNNVTLFESPNFPDSILHPHIYSVDCDNVFPKSSKSALINGIWEDEFKKKSKWNFNVLRFLE